MPGKRLLLATVVGITVGAVAAAAALVLVPAGTGRAERAPGAVAPGPEQPAPPTQRRDRRSRDRTGRPRPVERAESRVSYTARFSSDDPDVRHAAALELLRGGDDALAQARALRSTHPEGRQLLQRLIASLQALHLVRRGEDYDDLPQHERDALFLKYATRVVPEELLRTDRRATWEAKCAVDRERVARGFMRDGEAALSDLELARVRWELEELTDAAFAVERDRCVSRIESWLVEQRKDKRVAPARIHTIEQRVAELTR